MIVNVSNVGNKDGSEIPQLYLDFPAPAGEPPVQLRGFQRISVSAGSSATVKFGLSERALSIWNTGARNWQKITGEFVAYVGASSRDVRLKASFTVA